MILKSFFFAVAIISAILVLTPDAFAEQPTTTRHRTYQIEHYSNGTETQTLGMPEYVWDGAHWVDRITSNNGTHYNVYSEMGSFSFNKSTCTITQYVKGFNPITQTAHDSDIVINNWFWTIARKNGANPWSVIDASTFQCAISPTTNSTGKYLDMKRIDPTSGSYLDVKLAAPNGKNIEDYATLFMNKTAWNGNKFAFVLWAKNVKVDSLTFRNGTTILIPNGITMINKSQLTVNSMDFIKSGNAFFFDWKKAKDNFKMLVLNKTGSNVDIQFAFTDNAITLNAGQFIHQDPTYGYTATSNAYRVYTLNAASANCPAADTTTAFPLIQKEASAAADKCSVAVGQWDTTTIPDTMIVTQVNLKIDVDSVTNGLNCDVNTMANKPSTSTTQQKWNDATGGQTVVNNNAWCTTTGLAKVVNLGTYGSNATTYVQSKLASNFAAFGIVYNSMTRDGSGHEVDFSDLLLQVTYASALVPEAINTLAVTDFDSTSVDLGWSAPNLQGSTLQLYQINYTTPCGTPTTLLPNGTTATSYTVSGLSVNTCYSFRATGISQGGGNTTGANIVNVTTLAFNQANYTIGSFNFNANNPNLFPIRFERIDNGSSTYVNVTFANTINLACDLRYTYAGTNHTYHSIPSIAISGTEDESQFRFTNSSNDITTFRCWNQSGNETGNYVLTQTDFLLKQQVRDFRNGTYGTMGQFGAFDLITLIVVIISLIGLNRNTEAVAGIFCIMAITVLAYFDIVSWITAIVSAAAVIMLFIVAGTKKT